MLSDQAVNGALRSVGVEPEDGFGRVESIAEIGRALSSYWGKQEYIPSPGEDMDKPYIPLKQGLIYMSPIIEDNEIIFARDFGAHNKELMKRFPERSYFRMSLTETGYSLVEIFADD